MRGRIATNRMVLVFSIDPIFYIPYLCIGVFLRDIAPKPSLDIKLTKLTKNRFSLKVIAKKW